MSALLLCSSRIRECETALSQATTKNDIEFWTDELERISSLREIFKLPTFPEVRKHYLKEAGK